MVAKAVAAAAAGLRAAVRAEVAVVRGGAVEEAAQGREAEVGLRVVHEVLAMRAAAVPAVAREA